MDLFQSNFSYLSGSSGSNGSPSVVVEGNLAASGLNSVPWLKGVLEGNTKLPGAGIPGAATDQR